jgi:L-ascorbate metabolism protein UlaG (beta-lactamase superfamily)
MMAKLTYYSHSAWRIDTGGYVILIDPFLDDNPTSPVKASDVTADFIIITHAHGDHLGDAIPIAKAHNATIIANFEIANWCGAQGVQAHPLHIGGGAKFPFGMVKLTQAFHGSSFPDGSYGGMPAGVLITVEGKTIYHSGDTGLFGDMKLIAEMNPIDVALLPIGDNFTMGVKDAVKAVEFLKPKMVIPMHYQTFDIINADPQDFMEIVKKSGVKAQVIEYGKSIEI